MIVAKPARPEEKLYEYIACRLETMKEIVSRNGSLRAGFFLDVRKVDRARALISKKEIALLMDILHDGVDSKVFEIENVKESAIVIMNAIHGLDVPYIRNSLAEYGIGKEKMSELVANLVLKGILRH